MDILEAIMREERVPEPLTTTVKETARRTGECRSKVYEHIANGDYTAVKSGNTTLIIFATVKQYIASRPRVVIKQSKPRDVTSTSA